MRRRRRNLMWLDLAHSCPAAQLWMPYHCTSLISFARGRRRSPAALFKLLGPLLITILLPNAPQFWSVSIKSLFFLVPLISAAPDKARPLLIAQGTIHSPGATPDALINACQITLDLGGAPSVRSHFIPFTVGGSPRLHYSAVLSIAQLRASRCDAFSLVTFAAAAAAVALLTAFTRLTAEHSIAIPIRAILLSAIPLSMIRISSTAVSPGPRRLHSFAALTIAQPYAAPRISACQIIPELRSAPCGRSNFIPLTAGESPRMALFLWSYQDMTLLRGSSLDTLLLGPSASRLAPHFPFAAARAAVVLINTRPIRPGPSIAPSIRPGPSITDFVSLTGGFGSRLHSFAVPLRATQLCSLLVWIRRCTPRPVTAESCLSLLCLARFLSTRSPRPRPRTASSSLLVLAYRDFASPGFSACGLFRSCRADSISCAAATVPRTASSPCRFSVHRWPLRYVLELCHAGHCPFRFISFHLPRLRPRTASLTPVSSCYCWSTRRGSLLCGISRHWTRPNRINLVPSAAALPPRTASYQPHPGLSALSNSCHRAAVLHALLFNPFAAASGPRTASFPPCSADQLPVSRTSICYFFASQSLILLCALLLVSASHFAIEPDLSHSPRMVTSGDALIRHVAPRPRLSAQIYAGQFSTWPCRANPNRPQLRSSAPGTAWGRTHTLRFVRACLGPVFRDRAYLRGTAPSKSHLIRRGRPMAPGRPYLDSACRYTVPPLDSPYRCSLRGYLDHVSFAPVCGPGTALSIRRSSLLLRTSCRSVHYLRALSPAAIRIAAVTRLFHAARGKSVLCTISSRLFWQIPFAPACGPGTASSGRFIAWLDFPCRNMPALNCMYLHSPYLIRRRLRPPDGLIKKGAYFNG